jgi:hypothetical protein
MEGKRCEACAPELTRNKIKKNDRLLHINSFDLWTFEEKEFYE